MGLSRGRIHQIITSTSKLVDTLERASRRAGSRVDPLDVPVELLPISTRSRNALLMNGKRTLRDVLACSPEEILAMKNLGQACPVSFSERMVGSSSDSNPSNDQAFSSVIDVEPPRVAQPVARPIVPPGSGRRR